MHVHETWSYGLYCPWRAASGYKDSASEVQATPPADQNHPHCTSVKRKSLRSIGRRPSTQARHIPNSTQTMTCNTLEHPAKGKVSNVSTILIKNTSMPSSGIPN